MPLIQCNIDTCLIDETGALYLLSGYISSIKGIVALADSITRVRLILGFPSSFQVKYAPEVLFTAVALTTTWIVTIVSDLISPI